jgi:nitrite reductase (NADH) large subunit
MARYVIVGNGVAGTTAAEEIRKLDKAGTIVMLTEEDLPFYWRVRLIEFIAGEVEEKALVAKKESWYRDQKIELKLGAKVVDGDPSKKVVVTAQGEKIPFDRLLIASGSRSFVPPIKGSDKSGVFALRSIQDGRAILAGAKKAKEIVLIGGGLLGLEAGNSVRKLGAKVKVVEFFPRLIPRQLDVEGAKILQAIMEDMGFSFWLGAKTQEIAGKNGVESVLLEGGERLSADMVIISAGVRPAMDLAKPFGLETDKGIKVDERLQTNQADVYAAGDVAEFKGIPYGIWPAAMEQGKIAGVNMAGGDATYGGTTMSNVLKVVGIDLASAGEIDVDHKLESKVVVGEGLYRKIVLKDDRIIGCIMLGDKTGFNQVTRWMSEGRDVSAIKNDILSEGFDFKGV